MSVINQSREDRSRSTDLARRIRPADRAATLAGDEEQVYDLSLMDDQLVVGINATLSVVELKVLQQRLLQGQESKARRGELFRILAPGYVLDADGKVVKDPNQRVPHAIEMVFEKVRELWSIRQTSCGFITSASSCRSTRAPQEGEGSSGSCRR